MGIQKNFIHKLWKKSRNFKRHRLNTFLKVIICIIECRLFNQLHLFFPSMTFFFLVSSNLKGIICTPKLCSKKIQVIVLVQELQTIVPLYLVHLLKKQCHVPGMRAYSPDYVIFIRSKGFTSAKLRNHLQRKKILMQGKRRV